MNLNDLRYFALIVEHGGYTAAERITHLHRSKLSRRVALLEEELNVRLLQRSTRRLALTEAGEVFYQHCRAMVIESEAAREAVEMLRSEPVGTVRVSCPTIMANFYVAQLIAAFMVDHPKVRIQLDSTDRYVNLIEERVDIAIRARTGPLADPGLVARPVSTGRFVLVASPAYLASKGELNSAEQIAGIDTVGTLQGGEEQTWSLVASDQRSIKIVHRPRLLCSDLSVQYQAAISGVGVALLPQRIAARGLKYGALIRVMEEWGTAEDDIQIIFASRRGMLPSVRTLVDYLVAHLPNALAE